MSKIYILRHTIVRDGESHKKEIGRYSSRRLATLAIDRVKGKPGFRLPGGNFIIDSCMLDVACLESTPEVRALVDAEVAILKKVFFLYYVNEADEADAKEVGVYSSRALAERALERAARSPDLIVEGWSLAISQCLFNFDYWADGFGPADAG